MAAIFFCHVYRCSSTCWHLKTPALAQIHHRTEKPKTNSLFNQLNPLRSLVAQLEALWFRIQRYPVRIPPRSTLYFCVTFFLKVRTAKNFKVFHMNGDGLRTCAPVKSIKTSQQVFIGFKNFPTGYYRKLKTSGQSMCSNGRLAIETSVKSIIQFKCSTWTFAERSGCTSRTAHCFSETIRPADARVHSPASICGFQRCQEAFR